MVTSIKTSIYTLICALAFIGTTLQAQTIQIEAPQEVEQGRPFSVTYVVRDLQEDVSPISPKYEGLELLYGPTRNESSNVSITNGRVVSSSYVAFTYTFLAVSRGSFTISGFKLARRSGDPLTSRPHKISVIASTSGAKNISRMSKGYLYRTVVPRTSVYVQEALPVSYKVYSSTSFGVLDAKPPTYDGFISQRVEDTGRTPVLREDYQGASYQTAEVIREVLFPQRSGVLTLPSSEITLQIPVEIEGDPFLGSMMERKLVTSPVTINVKPLPEVGKPEDFSGAVGKFTVTSELSNQNPRTNEAFTLRCRIQGIGNLKIAKLPNLEFPRELEVYDPSDETEQTSDGAVVQATRLIEYNIIPRHTGRYTLPKFSFSYFDPSSKSYRRVETEPINIRVSQGKHIETNTPVVQSSKTEENAPYGLTNKVGASSPQGLSFVSSWKYPASYIALILLFTTVLIMIRKRIALRADVVGYSASRANAVAHKRLRLAKQYLDKGLTNQFYEELLRALWGYMGDKLRLPTSELSRTNVREHLERHSVEQDLIDAWCATLDEAEFARFAPNASSDAPKQLYQRAVETVTSVETSKKLTGK
ncbi:MAG: BatD family protein [Porphyromonadaceae bacterium]|nr:BatD family protein [Porphyromonadaceae bacterium]